MDKPTNKYEEDFEYIDKYDNRNFVGFVKNMFIWSSGLFFAYERPGLAAFLFCAAFVLEWAL